MGKCNPTFRATNAETVKGPKLKLGNQLAPRKEHQGKLTVLNV